MHVTCKCGKRAYETERQAEKALGRVQAKRRGRNPRDVEREHRYYECPESGLFHLTKANRKDRGRSNGPDPLEGAMALAWGGSPGERHTGPHSGIGEGA